MLCLGLNTECEAGRPSATPPLPAAAAAAEATVPALKAEVAAAPPPQIHRPWHLGPEINK